MSARFRDIRPVVLAILPVLAALGCDAAEVPGPTGIVPADGQTAWPTTLPLVVQGQVANYPEGQPAPQVIQVIDLSRGGTVAGRSEWMGDQLVFRPAEPWQLETDYLWTLRDPLDESRQPEFEIEPFLQGEALFSTRFGADVLNAGWSATGEICILLSRPIQPTEAELITITIDDEDIPLLSPRVLSGEELDEDAWIEAPDIGLGAMCAQPQARSGASRVRIFSGNRTYLRDMFFAEPEELAAAARRGAP